MRYFELLNLQHFVLYLFPALLALLLIATALGYHHFRGRDSEARQRRIIHTYPGNIEERNAPFPLFLWLVIIGTVLWGLAYILGTGWLGVKI